MRLFDYHGQLHGRSFHLDRSLRVRIKSAVNDVGPVNKIGHRRGIEAEVLLRDHGDETRTRLEIGIVELAVALVLLEVLRVGGREEGALVMIEPPRDFRRTGVLEVDDGVLVAIELLIIKQRTRAVDETGENEVGVLADTLAVEARKQRGGGSPVKALVVIENPDSQ